MSSAYRPGYKWGEYICRSFIGSSDLKGHCRKKALTASARRELAHYATTTHGASERRACRFLSLSRSVRRDTLKRPNQNWSADFMNDALMDSRSFRTFNVIDDSTVKASTKWLLSSASFRERGDTHRIIKSLMKTENDR